LSVVSESTVKLCLKAFIDVIETEFHVEFLRYSTTAELKSLMKRMSLRGFPGAWVSIDCSHMTWKTCLTALQGQYRNKIGQCSIVTEVVCDENLRAWKAFLGMPGSLNDINVLDHSPMVQDIMCGTFLPHIDYKIRGTTHDIPYLVADGLYPELPMLAKTFAHPATKKGKLYSNMQESARNDAERIFGVVQTTGKVLNSPSSLWDQLELSRLTRCIFTLHYMITEHRRVSGVLDDEDQVEYAATFGSASNTSGTPFSGFQNVTSRHEHNCLKRDLVDLYLEYVLVMLTMFIETSRCILSFHRKRNFLSLK
jgi:hypothetical protein